MVPLRSVWIEYAESGRPVAREQRSTRPLARLAAQRQPARDVAGQVSGAVDASIALDGVVQGLSSLPEAERDTLVLFAWESLSYGQISDSLGIPIGTVRSRIDRARKPAARTPSRHRRTT